VLGLTRLRYRIAIGNPLTKLDFCAIRSGFISKIDKIRVRLAAAPPRLPPAVFSLMPAYAGSIAIRVL